MSAEKDEFYRIQMQEFTIQTEEVIDAQRQLYRVFRLMGGFLSTSAKHIS